MNLFSACIEDPLEAARADVAARARRINEGGDGPFARWRRRAIDLDAATNPPTIEQVRDALAAARSAPHVSTLDDGLNPDLPIKRAYRDLVEDPALVLANEPQKDGAMLATRETIEKANAEAWDRYRRLADALAMNVAWRARGCPEAKEADVA